MMRAAPAAPRRAGLGDRVLDAALLGFAGWTLVYHVCVTLRLGAGLALALALPVVAAAVAAAWRSRLPPGAAPEEPSVVPVPVAVRYAGIAVGLAAAYLFAYRGADWPVVWALWATGAACGLLWLVGRRDRPAAERVVHGGWLERAVTAGWMAALALLALLTLNPDDDDSYYVRYAAWIADEGVFPVRDIMFGDQVFPALYWPPAGSYDPLLGALGRLTSLPVPDLAYFVVPPLASALAVLALRRLLRSWSVAALPVALSVALVFLLASSQLNQTYGAFFIGRIWQGKTLLLVLLVPLLIALLHEFGQRPTRAGAARLFAAGVAGVGLSTTAIFLVPVIAAGAMAALAVRSVRTAAAGLAAAVAYPAGAAVVTKLTGGRVPDQYVDADLALPKLVHLVLGYNVFAVLAVGALMIAPALIPRPLAARMTAATVLLVALLYAPGVPLAIFHATDLGRVLWRLNWALPVAALVGVLAVALVRARVPPPLKLLPAAALVAVMVVFARPPWDDQSARGLEWPPVHKRFPEELRAAEATLDAAGPGDLIWATRKVSQTVGLLEPDVTTVNPRGFFVTALDGEPALQADARKRLHILIQYGPEGLPGSGPGRIGYPRALEDLRALGVDLACPPREDAQLLTALGVGGWRRVGESAEVVCLRPSRG
jgi:hypothetical protein